MSEDGRLRVEVTIYIHPFKLVSERLYLCSKVAGGFLAQTLFLHIGVSSITVYLYHSPNCCTFPYLIQPVLFNMGCFCSTQGSSRPTAPRPASIPLKNTSSSSTRGTQHSKYPQRTERAMTQQIRTEFLNATQRAFGRLEYGVIGGTALAEYGNRRTTSDLDVIVPHDIIDVVEDHLLRHGMVRTLGRGIG